MPFDPPVPHIQIEFPGSKPRTLLTVTDLAQCLMYDFPGEGRANAYKTALMACLACLERSGDDSIEEVRAAFVDAAHEVDLFVLPDDGPDY